MTTTQLFHLIQSWTETTPDGGCSFVTAPSADAVIPVSASIAARTSLQVRLISGKRCQSTRAMFDTWACALSFPDYFGNNWMAFDECIGDREVFPRVPTMVFVRHAELLLSGETPKNREAFLRSAATLALGRSGSSYQSLPEFPFPALWIALFFHSRSTATEFTRNVSIQEGRIDQLSDMD
jgi:hypothetical protein